MQDEPDNTQRRTEHAALKDLSKNVYAEIKDLGSQVDADIKDLGRKVNSKFDRLMYLIVAGVVMKASFDLYINECNWGKTQQK